MWSRKMDLSGKNLGGYRIIEQLGRGGMADVYKAYQPKLDRYVAIKVLPATLARDETFLARFEREAKAVAKLRHRNILTVHDYGEEEGLTYLVMEYVAGGTLKSRLGMPWELGRAMNIILQIGDALAYAHSEGIVHRDVKPANVLMAREDWPLLSDFGLARMVEGSIQLTQSGMTLGTPEYMSPEQGQGGPADERSDIYALGIMLYEMLTGRPPFQADTPVAVILKHVNETLPLPRRLRPELPEAVERVILKALAKNPDDRYQRVEEMMEALKAAVSGVETLPPGVLRPSEIPALPGEAAPTVPEALPPAAKKLPGWAWGLAAGVLLLIVAAALLVSQGIGPPPTPTEAAIAFKISATLTAKATTETPTKTKTATPTGTPTPTPTMDADPTVYDNFNNPANEGSYNEGLWRLEATPDQVAQQGGAMMFTQQGKLYESAEMAARKYYNISIDHPAFFEARLMLSKDDNAGNVFIDLRTMLSSDKEWYAICEINGEEGEAEAGCFNEVLHNEQSNLVYSSESMSVEFGSWHTLRMEVDPAMMTFNYLVDGKFVGSHTPLDAEGLKKARFKLFVGIYQESEGALTGYVDDVRVGMLEALTPTDTPTPTEMPAETTT